MASNRARTAGEAFAAKLSTDPKFAAEVEAAQAKSRQHLAEILPALRAEVEQSIRAAEWYWNPKLPNTAQYLKSAKSNEDLVEWSRPMTKKQIASLLGCPCAKKQQWLNNAVKDGTYKLDPCTRQAFRIDLADVDLKLHSKFKASDN